MESTVERCLSRSGGELALEGTEEIKRWISLKEAFDAEEKFLKDGMSDRRRSVLSGKSLLLFKKLAADAGHNDEELTEHIVRGFDLTGMLPESKVFDEKVRPAVMSCEELRRVAELGRAGILQSVVSSGDLELDEQLHSATLKEVEKGFLTRVHDLSGLPKGATLTRRFGVQQKSKTRHAAMISCILRRSLSSGHSPELTSKTWDLADAYKQLPLSDEAFNLDSYLVVYSPRSKGPQVFQQSVLPFGSVASVTAF